MTKLPIQERLLRMTCVQIDPERQAFRPINPDGPEAAETLGELVAALEKIAANRPDGKCKAGTTCRTIARAALAKARQQ